MGFVRCSDAVKGTLASLRHCFLKHQIQHQQQMISLHRKAPSKSRPKRFIFQFYRFAQCEKYILDSALIFYSYRNLIT
jgi:hypothetical protein